MNKQQAVNIQKLAQADKRLQAKILKSGNGYRVRLTWLPGSVKQLTVKIRHPEDFGLLISIWEG